MREMRSAYKVFEGKPGGKSSSGRHKHRWSIILKLVIRRMGACELDSFGSA
jgi:hypothetical protein